MSTLFDTFIHWRFDWAHSTESHWFQPNFVFVPCCSVCSFVCRGSEVDYLRRLGNKEWVIFAWLTIAIVNSENSQSTEPKMESSRRVDFAESVEKMPVTSTKIDESQLSEAFKKMSGKFSLLQSWIIFIYAYTHINILSPIIHFEYTHAHTYLSVLIQNQPCM